VSVSERRAKSSEQNNTGRIDDVIIDATIVWSGETSVSRFRGQPRGSLLSFSWCLVSKATSIVRLDIGTT
jgi:hypothetical protein